MTRIDPEPLWIGSAWEGQQFARLLDLGIRAIVQLAVEEPPIDAPREMLLVRVPLVDGAENDRGRITLAVNVVVGLIDRAIPTFVCCGAGMSRAPLLVAAALATAGRGDLGHCLEQVHRYRATDVSPGLLEDVRQAMGWS